MTQRYTESELESLVAGILVAQGMAPDLAPLVAAPLVAAERDGTASHGLLRLPGYVGSLRSGWVDGHGRPRIQELGPGLLQVDAANNFAQVASAQVRGPLAEKARAQGLACAFIRNSHHFCALWPDIEPLVEQGLLAFTCVNSMKRMVVWGGDAPVLGTNPMAYGVPRPAGPPLIVDQALSVMAQGDILLAQQAGERLPEGVGLDARGQPTRDPAQVLEGGAFLPAGGHKGASLAFLVEVLAAALTGGNFSHQLKDRPAGALTFNAGQFLLALDPERIAGTDFLPRIEMLFEAVAASGADRLPGSRRYEHRRASREHGIAVSEANERMLREYLRG